MAETETGTPSTATRALTGDQLIDTDAPNGTAWGSGSATISVYADGSFSVVEEFVDDPEADPRKCKVCKTLYNQCHDLVSKCCIVTERVGGVAEETLLEVEGNCYPGEINPPGGLPDPPDPRPLLPLPNNFPVPCEIVD